MKYLTRVWLQARTFR